MYGWIEQVELDFYPRCDDGSLPRESALYHWFSLLMRATEDACKPLAYNTQTRQMLQQAGFTEVAEQVIRVPFHQWSTDGHENDIGTWGLLGFGDLEFLESLSYGPFSRVLRWDKGRIDKLLKDVRREILSRDYHVYVEMHIWTGRRPA